jgi:hypothetical protein
MSSNLSNVKENNEQILNDIQSLQQMEQELFNNLETNTTLTTTQKQEIVDKMNKISNMRISLYGTLSGVNNFYNNALSTSVGTLNEQVVAIGIVENELNQSKRRLEILEAERNNKIRLVEINDYYGDKYAEHTQLMKVIIYTLVPIIILAILKNKGILPNTIYVVLVIIVSFIGAYYFWVRVSSILTRDNLNYQEYNWHFNPGAAPKPSSSGGTDPWLNNNSTMGTCVGEACCSTGQTYDSTLMLCVNNSTTTTTATL